MDAAPLPEHEAPPAGRLRRFLRRAVLGLGVLFFAASVFLLALHSAADTQPLVVSLPAGPAIAPLTYGSWPALSNSVFYDRVEGEFINQGASFIDADLGTMQLSVYKSGAKVLTVPILAKGRPGSWWETPAGLYKIDSREKSHFSSIGNVSMPWSLDFEGNFFIHGWPAYPDGTPVASTFSGGCIRLSTDDAEKVYDLASVNMPVLVHEAPAAADSFTYRYAIPALTAKEYLVADVSDGTVLASAAPETVVPIASITKLMTALVVTEYVNLEKSITVPAAALVPTSKPRLVAGETISAYDLLFPLLLESSNEAAETFAAASGRDQFVGLMNAKAAAIGLVSTSFVDPSGAGTDNVSSAQDLYALLRYLANNRRFVLNVTAGAAPQGQYSGHETFLDLRNFNLVPGVTEKFSGGKIGMSAAADETYAGLFRFSVDGSDRTLAVVVLGSDDAYGDVSRLVSFVRSLYPM